MPEPFLEILEDQVQSGGKVHIRLQPPVDRPFIQQLRIFKDPAQEDIENNHWLLVNMLGAIRIEAEQNSAALGEPFSVEVDTLNYAPGVYYFVTFSPGANPGYVKDRVQILPENGAELPAVRADMTRNGRTFGLYSGNGQYITSADADPDPLPTLSMDTIYVLAIRLPNLKTMTNTIHVNFFDSAGLVLEKADLMRIKISRPHPFDSLLSLAGNCGGVPVDVGDYPDGIATVKFRTPAHLKYYEYDGQLHFHFGAVPVNDPGCQSVNYSFRGQLDDAPATAAIVDFTTHNRRTYPGQPWRNDHPFDRRRIRIVRFGSVALSSPQSLQEMVPRLETHFAAATKQYFRLRVEGTHPFALVQPLNQEKVVEWYQNVPKTPDKPVLNLDDPNQLYLATLLYYYERPEVEFVNDMKTVYPPRSSGEELTVYLFDGPGSLGEAMGESGSRVKVTRLYPAFVFYQGSGAGRTYHFDLASCGFCGNTVEGYLNFLERDGTVEQVINTVLHELGHTGWLGKAGVSIGDQATRSLPFGSDTVYEDDALGYFTRFEYMSYGRNRSSLEDMSYGDSYLERLLSVYAQPTASIEFVSHRDEGRQTITVRPNEEIRFNLVGRAGSGLKLLWYFNQISPVALPYGSPKKFGVFGYEGSGFRVREDRKEIRFTLDVPGQYVYRYRSRDRLYPIVWQSHQSVLGAFTINVRR